VRRQVSARERRHARHLDSHTPRRMGDLHALLPDGRYANPVVTSTCMEPRYTIAFSVAVFLLAAGAIALAEGRVTALLVLL
jgi:hypothetical protein